MRCPRPLHRAHRAGHTAHGLRRTQRGIPPPDAADTYAQHGGAQSVTQPIYGGNDRLQQQGKHLTSIILPPLSKLRRELDAAHAAPGGTGVYPDVDAATEELRSTLEELAPLADQMENYYAAGAYTTDAYAQADEMTAQFLPLYDRFVSAYDRLDAIVTDHYKEMRLAQIDAMHNDGRENAATFLELRTKTRELVRMLRSDEHDPEVTEAKIREINNLIEKLPAGTGYLVTYKNGINNLVAAVRAYNAGPPDPNKLDNVVEEFNRLAATGNNVDVNALDAKK